LGKSGEAPKIGDIYQQHIRKKWNNTDYYQLGYAYYKQNDFENAISQFNKIINGKDFSSKMPITI
jgi:TolA-binding protein